jgi:hypothetical protein
MIDHGLFSSVNEDRGLMGTAKADLESAILLAGSDDRTVTNGCGDLDRKRVYLTIGDGNIATIGISNAAVKGHTDFNIFSECGGNAVASGGTITVCIAIAATGCAIGNLAAVLAGQLLSGGTSAQRAVANYEAAATSAIL